MYLGFQSPNCITALSKTCYTFVQVVVTFLTYIREVLGSISRGVSTIVVFISMPGQIPGLPHGCFLPYPFQFGAIYRVILNFVWVSVYRTRKPLR
jgi:hypothetical protein